MSDEVSDVDDAEARRGPDGDRGPDGQRSTDEQWAAALTTLHRTLPKRHRRLLAGLGRKR